MGTREQGGSGKASLRWERPKVVEPIAPLMVAVGSFARFGEAAARIPPTFALQGVRAQPNGQAASLLSSLT